MGFELYNLYKGKGGILRNSCLPVSLPNGMMVENGGDFMRDFPIFTTEYGVSSLVLKEIPYRQEAYIHIQDYQEGFFTEHLAECVSFCRMCGAERIFAKGDENLTQYPLYTSVYQMCGKARSEEEKLASLFPVTEATVSRWRDIYNKGMQNVDNAGTLESRDEKRIVDSGSAYFVHRSGDLLGIFWLEDNKLLAIAAAQKGAGETVMHTMMSLLEGESMTLEVASTNERAIRLYEKAGFLKTEELTRWYRVG